MYNSIRMSSKKNNKVKIVCDWPILPGTITTARSKCGKPNCACKSMPDKLHGTYYRWTGVIDGKRTTKTISKEVALECRRRIRNYKKLQQKIRVLLKNGLDIAPWKNQD